VGRDDNEGLEEEEDNAQDEAPQRLRLKKRSENGAPFVKRACACV
jgi:hypothetical protein